MSEPGFLEKLLDGADVEWVPLGKVAILQRGRVMSKNYLSENEGDYPVYSSQTSEEGMIGKIGSFDFDGEFVSWTTDGANAGTVFYRTGKFSVTNVCGVIKSNGQQPLNQKYLFYWLSIEAKKHVNSGMGNPKLMSHQVGKILIPIPSPNNLEKSLAIQAEIVRILDAFNELTTELTKELTTRKKQYNYYRDQLLTFDNSVDVTWKPLKNVLIRTKGTKITAAKMKTLQKNGAPLKIFAGGNTVAFVNFSDIPENDVNREPSIIVKSRGVIAFEYYDRPFSHKNEMWSYHSQGNIEIKYIYHFLKLNEPYFQRIGSKMQMPQISIPITDEFLVPIPYPDNPEKSLAEQARIVAILDKFDTLTTSLSEGLPREIELRQKQYTYYRDLLFNFPKPDENVT